MKSRTVISASLATLALAVALLFSATDALAQATTKTHRDLGSGFLQCVFCHSLHGAPGGTLNTRDTFDNTCLSCHGSVSPDPNAPNPIASHTNTAQGTQECTGGGKGCPERPFYLGCDTCHFPHGNLQNRLYDQTLDHTHADPALCESAGGLVRCDGLNRKLVGIPDAGTGTADIPTPITVGGGSWAAGVATINLSVNNATNPPAHTFMAGDRITVRHVWSANNSAGAFETGFNGEFIVESVTNPYTLTPTITYKLAADPGAYMQNSTSKDDPESGMVQSRGWHDRSKARQGVWAAGTATLTLTGVAHSIEAGDSIAVTDVLSANNTGGGFNAGFNGIVTVTAVAGREVSYALATDPGAFQNLPASPGRVEYAGSLKVIQAATQGATTLTVRIFNTHAIVVDSIVTAFKDNPDPAAFSALDSVKRLQVTAIAAFDADRDDVTLSCLNQAIEGNEVCDLSIALAVDFTGGVIQSSGSLKHVVLESRGTNFGEDSTHSFADVDQDGDNVMDGPCELCHTRAGINHPNYDYTDAHHVGQSCSLSCHTHDRGFFR